MSSTPGCSDQRGDNFPETGGGSFSRVKELIAKIEQFLAAYNDTKAPFNWTATADSILEKLQRLCSQIFGKAH
jgi:putative transposase